VKVAPNNYILGNFAVETIEQIGERLRRILLKKNQPGSKVVSILDLSANLCEDNYFDLQASPVKKRKPKKVSELEEEITKDGK
jgi:hypothetical protein